MKYAIFLKIFIVIICLFSTTIKISSQNHIIDKLQKDTPLEGQVRIISDPTITALIGKPGIGVEGSANKQFLKTQGYRISV